MNHNVDWVSSGSHANTNNMSSNTTTANADASQFQFQQWNQSQSHSTMVVNTAAHLPDHFQESSKRQRDDPAAFFLVSQDEESSASSCTGMEMEMDFQSDDTYPAGNHRHHYQKRQRFCPEVEDNSYGNPLSPGMMSIATTSTDHEATPKSNPFTLSAKQHPQTKPPAVAWWKQKPQNQNKQNIPNSTSTCCFICQKTPNPKTPLPQASIQRRAPATMRPNALLAYLTPLQSASSSSGRGRTRSPSLSTATATSNTATTAATPSHPDQTPCTFCERAVCSDCLGQCQDCQQVYCSLCRTTDYNSCNTSRLERTLCLDCAAVCNENGDSMHLD